MESTGIRLLAHLLTLGLLLAVIGCLIMANGKPLNWRHWRLLCAVLATYAIWFFLLSISLRDTGLLKRAEMIWSLGLIELAGASAGWTWLVLSVRLSFRVAPNKPPGLQVNNRPTMLS